MSALMGAFVVTAATLLTVGRLSGGLWPATWARWIAPLAVSLVMAGVSVALQYRWALRRERRQQEQRKSEGERAESEPSSPSKEA